MNTKLFYSVSFINALPTCTFDKKSKAFAKAKREAQRCNTVAKVHVYDYNGNYYGVIHTEYGL